MDLERVVEEWSIRRECLFNKGNMIVKNLNAVHVCFIYHKLTLNITHWTSEHFTWGVLRPFCPHEAWRLMKRHPTPKRSKNLLLELSGVFVGVMCFTREKDLKCSHFELFKWHYLALRLTIADPQAVRKHLYVGHKNRLNKQWSMYFLEAWDWMCRENIKEKNK